MGAKRSRRAFGLLAQALAERYLVEKKGWTILARNVRDGRAEADLIGKTPEGAWRAVEVKGARGTLNPDGSVRHLPSVLPLEHINPDQLARVARVLRSWRRAHGGTKGAWAVDACLVVVDEAAQRARVEHVEGLLEGEA